MRWGLFTTGVLLAAALIVPAAGQRGAIVPHSIAFTTLEHGVLGTDRSLAFSRDGGRTWSTSHRGRGPFVVQTITGTGTVVATSPSGIHESRDEGRTWRRTTPRRPIGRASFVSSRFAWAVSHAETAGGDRIAILFVTRDGGVAWRRAGRLCRPSGFEHAAVSAVTPQRGWLLCAGQPAAGHQQKAIYATVDGGRSWSTRACACGRPLNRGRIASSGYAAEIQVRHGLGVMLLHRGSAVSVSRDGGRTWSSTCAVRCEWDYGDSVSIISRSVIFALVGQSIGPRYLVRSRDAGRRWTVVAAWPRA